MPFHIGCATSKDSKCVKGTTAWGPIKELQHNFVPLTPTQAYRCSEEKMTFQTTGYREFVIDLQDSEFVKKEKYEYKEYEKLILF